MSQCFLKYIACFIYCVVAGSIALGCGVDGSEAADDNLSAVLVTCGNGVLDSGEVCDGSDLGGATCQSEGFAAGALGCANNCMAFDASSCEGGESAVVKSGGVGSGVMEACVPSTCQQLNTACGTVDDGCGTLLECNECMVGFTCGGGGDPNVCGPMCNPGCPSGFMCNQQGVCVGNSETITVNMPTANVQLVVKVNGQTPQPSPNCVTGTHPLATVTLTSVSHQWTGGTYDMPCDGSPLNVIVPKSKYSVKVQGKNTLNNQWPILGDVVHELIDVDQDMTITSDVPAATIKLVATVDGEIPPADPATCPSGSNGLAYVSMTRVDGTGGTSFSLPCDGTPLEVVVGKANYDFRVRGGFTLNEQMPRMGYRFDRIKVDQDMNINADMPTTTINLSAKADGQAFQRDPVLCVMGKNGLATIRLYDTFGSPGKSFDLPCSGLPLEVTIPLTRYHVEVAAKHTLNSQYSNIAYKLPNIVGVPNGSHLIANMPTTSVNLNAKVNGQTPAPNPSTCSPGAKDLASVMLTNLTSKSSQFFPFPCDQSSVFTRVPKGEYSVDVMGKETLNGQMPKYLHRTHESIDIHEFSSITADMPTAKITLQAKLNGQSVQPDPGCDGNPEKLARIRLGKMVGGFLEILDTYEMPCDGSSVQVIVPQNTYQVEVKGEHTLNGQMLQFWNRTYTDLEIGQNMAITADMRTKTIKLLPKLNGQTPQPGANCQPGSTGLTHIRMRDLRSEDIMDYLFTPCDGSALEVVVPKSEYLISITGRFTLNESMPQNGTYGAIQHIEIE